MEVVLQWLDELDDVVVAALSCHERLRRAALNAGFLAALALVGCELGAAAVEWMPLLSALSAAGVAVWAGTAAAGALLEGRSSIPARA